MKTRWVKGEFLDLFKNGMDETFHDGYETQFSRRLLELIEFWGESSVSHIQALIDNKEVHAIVIEEALRWIGRMDKPNDRLNRECRLFLEHCLDHEDSRVREGAGLGLASMDDPKSLPTIVRAIEKENYQWVKEGLKQVRDQLCATQQGWPPGYFDATAGSLADDPIAAESEKPMPDKIEKPAMDDDKGFPRDMMNAFDSILKNAIGEFITNDQLMMDALEAKAQQMASSGYSLVITETKDVRGRLIVAANNPEFGQLYGFHTIKARAVSRLDDMRYQVILDMLQNGLEPPTPMAKTLDSDIPIDGDDE